MSGRCAHRLRSRAPRRAAHGDSLLEFALVLPILLMLCVGMIQYGLVLLAQNQMLFAVREGVRQAALYGNPDVGTATAMQDMVSVPWAGPRAVLNGCNSYGEPCQAEMCATYNLMIPFLPWHTITLDAYAEALSERSTPSLSCADSLGVYPKSSSCQPQRVNTCPTP